MKEITINTIIASNYNIIVSLCYNNRVDKLKGQLCQKSETYAVQPQTVGITTIPYGLILFFLVNNWDQEAKNQIIHI